MVEDAKRIAFGFLFGGSEFLELEAFKTPIQARNFHTIMRRLYDRNDKIEQFLDTYSILATPQLVLLLHEHLKRIDETILNLCFLYTYQIAKSDLNNDNEVPKAIFGYSRREIAMDPLDTILSADLKELSISSSYRCLRECYDALLARLREEQENKATFTKVLLHDSLLSGFLEFLLPWAKRTWSRLQNMFSGNS